MFRSAKDTVEVVSQFCNVLDRGYRDEFVQAMACEHRTLQQAFTGICLAWLCHLAALPEHHYDARNEASVRAAKAILKAVPDIKYGLPLI